MENCAENVFRVLLIGIGATALMDLWLVLLKRVGVPTMNFAFVGRWIAHIFRGQWFHAAIAKAELIGEELIIGWLAHYAIGIGFAVLLVFVSGTGWIYEPSFVPAIATGLATAIIPLFIMQPAMGAGIASSRTATPLLNSVKSVLNHSVFGFGLYLSGRVVACLV